MLKYSKKSQTFSIDFIIAIAIFIGAIIFFYSLLKSGTGSGPLSLQEEAIFIARQTAEQTSVLFFVDEVNVNENKLETIAGKNYEELQRKLNIRYDFSIHFEDKNGVIPIEEGVINQIGIDVIDCGDNIIKAHKIVNRKGIPIRLVVTSCE